MLQAPRNITPQLQIYMHTAGTTCTFACSWPVWSRIVLPASLALSCTAGTAVFVLMPVAAYRAEERKRKLREAAQATAESGVDTKVFGDSDYMVGEDARTPNVHSRQVCFQSACAVCKLQIHHCMFQDCSCRLESYVH